MSSGDFADEVDAVPFRDAICVTNIPFINGNDTSFCLKVNGEHAGESFKSLRLILFEIYSCKVENSSILVKFDL